MKLRVEELEPRSLLSCTMPAFTTNQLNAMIAEQNAVEALVPLSNVTDEAIGGNWSNPASWKSGHLPGLGANIEIDPGIQEVYDLASNPAYNTIRVDGVLSFSQAANTGLLVQTIVDMPGGVFNDVQPNPSITSTVTFADTGPLDLTNDPKELSRGFIALGLMLPDGTMGPQAITDVEGAAKNGWFSFAGINAGSTSLTLSVAPTGWQLGDKLLFNGTGAGSQDETDTIANVSPDGLTFSLSTPLLYNHIPPTAHSGAMETTVADLSRNIIFDSQTPGPLRGGHIMFMHTDADVFDYVEMDGLGRTDKSKPLGTLTADTNGELVENVPARYSIHFHRLFNFSLDCTVKVVGDVVTGGPGWGYDNHSSNVNFTDNIDYGTYGAGFVNEAGDEIGSYVHNLAVHNMANHTYGQDVSPTTDQSRKSDNDFVFNGDGFWTQCSYGVTYTNNTAVESGSSGFYAYEVGLVQPSFTGDQSQTQFWRQNITDVSILKFAGPTGIRTGGLPLQNFNNNTCILCNDGLWIGATPKVSYPVQTVNNFTTWGTNRNAIEVYYANSVNVDGLIALANPNLSSGYPTTHQGFSTTRGYSFNDSLSNADIEGFFYGVYLSGKGTNVIDGGFYDNITSDLDIQGDDYGGNSKTTIQGNVQFGTRALHHYNFVPTGRGNVNTLPSSLAKAFFRMQAIYLDTRDHPNSEIFMPQQAWDVDPFTLANGLTSADIANLGANANLTNGQMMQAYGRTFMGIAAPEGSPVLEGSNGWLVGAMQPSLPNWQLISSVSAASLVPYLLKYSTNGGMTVINQQEPPLSLGWNFETVTNNGQTLNFMVLGT